MTIDEAEELVKSHITEIHGYYVVRRDDACGIADKIVHKMQAEIDKLSVENAKYEAKIFAYEAILQNSNFKMAVIRKKEEK